MTSIYSRRRLLCLMLAITTLFVWSQPSAAQNPSVPPAFGNFNLQSGFSPDPSHLDLVAGGPIRTDQGGLLAYVSNGPDVRINYVAGPRVLTFYVQAAANTTLLIRLPSGAWIADDNSGGGLNPMIRIANPLSGRYDIFVGTVREGIVPAQLFVTEQR